MKRVHIRKSFATNLRRERERRGLSKDGPSCWPALRLVVSVERGECRIFIDDIERLALALRACRPASALTIGLELPGRGFESDL